MKYTYDIQQFKYDKETNTLFAPAHTVYAEMEDGNIHKEPFPNGRKEFYIKNYETNNERRFRFVEEERDYQELYDQEGNIYGVAFDPIKTWVFESEDGIKCKVRVD
jgi:hypothetical protein